MPGSESPNLVYTLLATGSAMHNNPGFRKREWEAMSGTHAVRVILPQTEGGYWNKRAHGHGSEKGSA